MTGEEFSPLERDVQEIWRAVLGRDDISLNSNFFDLGGNSLHCMKVLLRLREKFQIDLEIESVFLAPTVTQQAQMIRDA